MIPAEVIKDTKITNPRHERFFFFKKHIYASRVKEIPVRIEVRRKFGEVAVYVHKHESQGEVVLVGYSNSRIGKASNPNENIGQYGEATTNKNGADMLKFRKNNEMKTLNDRVKKSKGQNGLDNAHKKGESSVLDFIVVKNGSGKETEIRMRSGRRNYRYGSLPNMDSPQTTVIKIGAVGNCADGEQRISK